VSNAEPVDNHVLRTDDAAEAVRVVGELIRAQGLGTTNVPPSLHVHRAVDVARELAGLTLDEIHARRDRVTQLERGQVLVLFGRATEALPVEFLGWTNPDAAGLMQPVYKSTQDMFGAFGYQHLRECAEQQESSTPHIYAVFRDLSHGVCSTDTFGCYFFEGRLCAGSSADPVFFSLREAQEYEGGEDNDED
jgi:hypothetical protein